MTPKEILGHLNVYKELIALLVAAVGGVVYVANYFATKEALDSVKKGLDIAIGQHNCNLANQILLAQSSARLGWLEKDRIDKIRETTNLEEVTLPKAPEAVIPYLKTQLGVLKSDLAKTESEIKLETHKRDTAQDIINGGKCNS